MLRRVTLAITAALIVVGAPTAARAQSTVPPEPVTADTQPEPVDTEPESPPSSTPETTVPSDVGVDETATTPAQVGAAGRAGLRLDQVLSTRRRPRQRRSARRGAPDSAWTRSTTCSGS